MDELLTLFPSIVLQLGKAFSESKDFMDHVRKARIVRVTYDSDANAGYIYVQSGRALNVVEQNVIGVKHGHTMEVPGEMWMCIDVDNFERLMGVEILAVSAELAEQLRELSRRAP